MKKSKHILLMHYQAERADRINSSVGNTDPFKEHLLHLFLLSVKHKLRGIYVTEGSGNGTKERLLWLLCHGRSKSN